MTAMKQDYMPKLVLFILVASQIVTGYLGFTFHWKWWLTFLPALVPCAGIVLVLLLLGTLYLLTFKKPKW